ncbi:MAG: ABC transporter ATP-binding protein [Pseudomonadota bacterium]|nr:ABC transporter ATP-binding protein [Pseudomonadota bacterium]
MIQLHQVKKAFNQRRPNEFWAIRGVDLRIEPHQATVLKGPSGSGKTTLLSMIGCLSRPTSGRITLGERSLSGLPERFMTEIRRRTFGFIFQQFNLIKGMTVLENVMLPAYPLGRDHHQLKQAATDLLRQFGIESKAGSKVEWLSGGEAQRTAICRALINDPEILIADEPTANLDTKLSTEFMNIIAGLKASGKTILLTSHDPVVFESTVADRVVEMRDGIVVDRCS